jgi:hypothetical protein
MACGDAKMVHGGEQLAGASQNEPCLAVRPRRSLPACRRGRWVPLRGLSLSVHMQSDLLQTINALLQQFQQPQVPSSPSLPPELPSVTVNAVQQQLLQSIRAIGQNTPQRPGFNRLFQPSQQQTPQAPCVPASSSQLQLLSDALKMIAPVGQSPNDEQLLVMALHSGLSQGLDHRRAIETLHGVCSLITCLPSHTQFRK